ncbi:MAG: fibronectin type III domain-containing protein [Candidatus Sulfotelmatobacter sp.]
MTGCASIGPPTAPSLELPKPPTDLKAARKGNKVTLTWTIPKRTMDRQSVRYLGKTQVCRNVGSGHAAPEPAAPETQPAGDHLAASIHPVKECGTVVGSVAAPADFLDVRKTGKKLSAAFVDTLPTAIEAADPAGFATYGVSVMNEAGRSAGLSNLARVPLVPTVTPFADFAAKTEARGVMISWQCPKERGKTAGVKYLFRIHRRAANSAVATKIADVEATDCIADAAGQSNAFLDSSIEWENTYFYRGAVVSVIEAGGKPVEVEGDDTPEIRVFAHDIFPPAVPTGLQAVYSGPGQPTFIDLIWAPVTDADLAGYNVYRHDEGGGAPAKLNAEVVKTPAYRDSAVAAGKTYFYSVSSVDRQGNESVRSEETSERIP